MPFNLEFAILEARLAEFGDVVDVFIVLESNYTAYGKPKPLRLLEMLCQGKYRRYAHKIVHVWLDYFPNGARRDGWITDRIHRDYMGEYGLRYLIRGYRQDDLFVLTDADELPYRETLLFLKLHDGYPEPVSHSYRQTIYGFYWKSKDYMTCSSTVSIGLLTHVLHLKAFSIRKGLRDITTNAAALNTYLKSHRGVSIRNWIFGNNTNPAGWHCSWCFDPEGIQNKLTSALNADFPRWGDYPDKVKISYIQGLVTTGMWFDNKNRFTPRGYTDSKYAPEYILQHRDVYRNVLENKWLVSNVITTTTAPRITSTRKIDTLIIT
jgi:beta-1,4-mannosyl-glycoprotein beta-1,4-N-acetylglucosaminyltransferase